jgi:hypothetical protein
LKQIEDDKKCKEKEDKALAKALLVCSLGGFKKALPLLILMFSQKS